MATPEYFGTAGADTVVRTANSHGASGTWAHYFGGAGNDKITWSTGQALGEAGDDTIIRAAGDNNTLMAAYWTSPVGIVADLQTGKVQDGFGGTDTLVNVSGVSGSGRGDTIYGSSSDDIINDDYGKNYIDGRGGADTFGVSDTAKDWKIEVSADARTAWVTRISDANRSSELHNIEIVTFYGTNERIRLTDLIDKSKVGIEALVETQSVRWNASDALGSAVTLSYSFTDTKPAYGYGTSGSGQQAWTTAQKAAVRAALATIAAETQITFNEVTDTAAAYGQMRFGINTQTSTTAYAFSPATSNGEMAGDVWLSTATAASIASNTTVLLREISRALGLVTPMGESYTGTRTVLLNSENDTRYSVMATTDATTGLTRDNLGMYDLSALRTLYGSKSIASGDTAYTYSDATGRAQVLIVDDGGNNSISAANVNVGARIDLRPGMFSSIGRDAQDLAAVDNVGIAIGSAVNTATGSRYDDYITGNSNDNFLKGLEGNDLIDGGAGNDTAQYTDKASAYTAYLSSFSGDLIVAARDGISGTDSLRNIESLQFADGSYLVVAGAANATSISGAAAAEILLGNDLNNTLTGGGGNDYLEGGSGTDTAVFTGKRSNYSITVGADGNVKVAAKSGSEGTDTLDGVERITFSDMTVNLTVGTAAKGISAANLQMLEELYVGFFNRVPDADGLAYWISQIADGTSLTQVGDAFYGAAVQYSSLTGYTGNMTNNAFINIVYKNVLGRDSADQGGLDYWNAQLNSGAATRGSLVVSIISAAHTYKGDKTYGYVADLLDNKFSVATAFALQQALSYVDPNQSITQGMAIAAAVTPTDTSAALKLIGVADPAIVVTVPA